MVQEDYHSQNPYHNAVHAADVTQAMYCYLKEPKVGVLFLILPSFFFLVVSLVYAVRYVFYDQCEMWCLSGS